MPTISSHHDHSHAHAAPLNDDDLRDPVCGMAVTSPSKFGESYQGQAYQFCSLKCQEKFRADPERYSGNVSSAESRVTTQSLRYKQALSLPVRCTRKYASPDQATALNVA